MVSNKLNFTRSVAVLILSFAVVAGFAVWHYPHSAAAARPIAGGNFKINFDYSKAEHPRIIHGKGQTGNRNSRRNVSGFYCRRSRSNDDCRLR